MEPLLELNLDYMELMTVAAALGLLIEQDTKHAKNFKKAGMPDLATPRIKAAEKILEQLRNEQGRYKSMKGIV
jgi:hypothetical protein